MLETKGLHLKNENTKYKYFVFALCNEYAKKRAWNELIPAMRDKEITYEVVFQDEWQKRLNELLAEGLKANQVRRAGGPTLDLLKISRCSQGHVIMSHVRKRRSPPARRRRLFSARPSPSPLQPELPQPHQHLQNTRPLFSYSYKMLLPQLPCFDIHVVCPGVYPPSRTQELHRKELQ